MLGVFVPVNGNIVTLSHSSAELLWRDDYLMTSYDSNWWLVARFGQRVIVSNKTDDYTGRCEKYRD